MERLDPFWVEEKLGEVNYFAEVYRWFLERLAFFPCVCSVCVGFQANVINYFHFSFFRSIGL